MAEGPDSKDSASPGRSGSESGERGGKKPQPNPMTLMGAGMELGLVAAAFALGGWWLDNKYGTRPWFLVTGLAIGVIGGMYNLWRTGKRFFE